MNTLHKERLWGILVFMKVIRPLFPKHSKHKTYRSVSVSKCTPVRTKALIAKKKDINTDTLLIKWYILAGLGCDTCLCCN